MSFYGLIIMILLGAIFIFTLKNLMQLKFKESNLIEKARNLRNFLFGFIAFVCIFFLTGKFSKELGIKTSCNSFQQQHHPEKCEVEKE